MKILPKTKNFEETTVVKTTSVFIASLTHNKF